MTTYAEIKQIAQTIVSALSKQSGYVDKVPDLCNVVVDGSYDMEIVAQSVLDQIKKTTP